MVKARLNIKKHKKACRKIMRKDKGWEEILSNLTIEEINKTQGAPK